MKGEETWREILGSLYTFPTLLHRESEVIYCKQAVDSRMWDEGAGAPLKALDK